MSHVVATRTELLALRDEIALAVRSRALLEEKRTELLKGFRRAAESVLEGSDALERAASEGARALTWAVASEGPESIGSAALAAQEEVRLEVLPAVLMGVRVPEIQRPSLGRARTARGYTLAGTTARVDEVADRFERQLALLLQVATLELQLRRLGQEIAKVTRRVNALEHVVVPDRKRRAARIEMVLDEREREDRFRLKRLSARKREEGP